MSRSNEKIDVNFFFAMLGFVFFHFIFAVGAHNLSSISDFDDTFRANLIPQTYHEPSSPRHYAEKSRLLNSLKYEIGEWGSNHPRYQLLQALQGLYRYKDSYFTDIDQWKDLFDGISEAQKEVYARSYLYVFD
jgi:hypothetical protein